ncbi:MAG: UPF0175 family protein [Symploca sp. SIO1B1]|nr:UPF0175 family protein [Symploca sp. SIO1C2]NER96780.1 UPF0175 family protein [Symploca sp. SIO1B1]
MDITISLPDKIVSSLKENWGDLEERLLEAIVLDAYKEGLISAGKVGELLGIPTRLEADAFLKSKGIHLTYSEADFEADRQTHEELRREGKLKAL